MKKVFLFFCFFLVSPGNFSQQQAKSGDNDQQLAHKKLCLAATVTAIKLEIANFERWKQNREQSNSQNNLAELQKSLDILNADLKKYQDMNADDYILPGNEIITDDFFTDRFTPQKISSTAWVENKADKNSILYVNGMSKSGPWYHLAGIAGNDFSVLQPNKHYQLVFYTVYEHYYFNMPSAYVCVVEIKK